MIACKRVGPWKEADNVDIWLLSTSTVISLISQDHRRRQTALKQIAIGSRPRAGVEPLRYSCEKLGSRFGDEVKVELREPEIPNGQ